MNEKLLNLLEGQKQLYPFNLEEKYLRILNQIVELWDTREIDDYFNELMMDTRNGNRQGFPTEVASEIFALSIAHSKIREVKQKSATGNPWDEVEVAKRSAIEQQGYSFSPKGFVQSAEKGDNEAVLLFLNSGVDIDTRNEQGWTPLMISTFNGREEVAALLIRRGANVHAKDDAGYGPLHWAAFNGYSNVIKLLLEKRANVNERSKHGWSPLLQAATRGHLVAAGQLIASGADVNLASNDGWTPLHKAAANGHLEVVKLLLIKGAFRGSEYQDGTTPLHLAIKNKHPEIAELLSGKV